MEVVYLICTGLSVGFISSFFGIGGGVITIPMLFILFPNVPVQAFIPVSLGLIFLNSTTNNYHFYKSGLSPSKKTFLNLFITCLIGAGVGSYILYLIDSDMIKKVFASLLVLSFLKTLFSKAENQVGELKEPQMLLGITGFLGSFISSITGLGGGIIFVPMLLSLIKLPIIYISPFSNAAMMFATLIGIIPHLLNPLETAGFGLNSFYEEGFVGHVNFVFIIILYIGSILSSKLGTRLNTKVEFKTKKYLLSFLLAFFAVRMFLN
jgi:uncharacterized membrane protein YfcA